MGSYHNSYVNDEPIFILILILIMHLFRERHLHSYYTFLNIPKIYFGSVFYQKLWAHISFCA